MIKKILYGLFYENVYVHELILIKGNLILKTKKAFRCSILFSLTFCSFVRIKFKKCCDKSVRLSNVKVMTLHLFYLHFWWGGVFLLQRI